MDAGAIATVSTTLLTCLALMGYVRVDVRELRGEIKDVRADLKRLDDRVYALAVGIRPLLDEGQRSE